MPPGPIPAELIAELNYQTARGVKFCNSTTWRKQVMLSIAPVKGLRLTIPPPENQPLDNQEFVVEEVELDLSTNSLRVSLSWRWENDEIYPMTDWSHDKAWMLQFGWTLELESVFDEDLAELRRLTQCSP